MKKKIIRYAGEKLILDENKIKEYKRLMIKLQKIQKELEPLDKQIKEDLQEYMKATEKKTLEFEGLIAKFTPGFIRNVFNSRALMKDDIETYTKYISMQNVNSSLSIKLNN